MNKKKRTTMKLDMKKVISDPCYFIEAVIYAGTGYKLTPYQKEWLMISKARRRVTFMAFRTSGKSRQLFCHYFLWNAITRPNTEYILLSKTLPQAVELLKTVRMTLLSTPALKSLIPKNRAQTWSRTEIEFSNNSRILSKTANDNVRGMHVNGVGADELGEWQDQTILRDAILPTLLSKRGFFIGVGTPRSELDLLHAIERDPGYSSIYFDRYPAEGPKGNLFEQRYPGLKIEHREGAVHIIDVTDGKTVETYDNLTWSQEFLLQPVSMKDRLFPEHLITACMDHQAIFSSELKNMHQYFMGVDFAMSAQAGSDFTVLTILEKSPGSKKLVVKLIERWRGVNYNEQKRRIKEIAESYQVVKILGDEGSFGKIFIYDLKAEGLPIEGYKFTHQSRSKEEIIKALRDQFEQQGFIIPYGVGCTKTRPTVDVLLDELAKFGIIFDTKSKTVKFEGTGAHDDTVISLALANFIARHISMACFAAIKGSHKGFNPFSVAVK
jgi:phage terminase large subunit-like protein